MIAANMFSLTTQFIQCRWLLPFGVAFHPTKLMSI